MNIIYPFNITFLDYPDDISHAIIVYMMGCDNSCSDCQNLNFKSPEYSLNTKIFTVNELIKDLTVSSKTLLTNKIVLSGGDPLSIYNIKETKELLTYKDFEFIIYTGKDIMFAIDNNVAGFKYIKCGLYNNKLKQPSEKTDEYLKFASKNQTLYDENYNEISNNGIYYFNN
jgi:organic radical activating enzyme